MKENMLNEFIEFAHEQHGVTIKAEKSSNPDTFAKIFSGLLTPSSITKRHSELYRLVTEIEYVSGYNLETLLELFKAGYTLKAPDYKINMEVK